MIMIKFRVRFFIVMHITPALTKVQLIYTHLLKRRRPNSRAELEAG